MPRKTPRNQFGDAKNHHARLSEGSLISAASEELTDIAHNFYLKHEQHIAHYDTILRKLVTSRLLLTGDTPSLDISQFQNISDAHIKLMHGKNIAGDVFIRDGVITIHTTTSINISGAVSFGSHLVLYSDERINFNARISNFESIDINAHTLSMSGRSMLDAKHTKAFVSQRARIDGAITGDRIDLIAGQLDLLGSIESNIVVERSQRITHAGTLMARSGVSRVALQYEASDDSVTHTTGVIQSNINDCREGGSVSCNRYASKSDKWHLTGTLHCGSEKTDLLQIESNHISADIDAQLVLNASSKIHSYWGTTLPCHIRSSSKSLVRWKQLITPTYEVNRIDDYDALESFNAQNPSQPLMSVSPESYYEWSHDIALNSNELIRHTHLFSSDLNLDFNPDWISGDANLSLDAAHHLNVGGNIHNLTWHGTAESYIHSTKTIIDATISLKNTLLKSNSTYTQLNGNLHVDKLTATGDSWVMGEGAIFLADSSSQFTLEDTFQINKDALFYSERTFIKAKNIFNLKGKMGGHELIADGHYIVNRGRIDAHKQDYYARVFISTGDTIAAESIKKTALLIFNPGLVWSPYSVSTSLINLSLTRNFNFSLNPTLDNYRRAMILANAALTIISFTVPGMPAITELIRVPLNTIPQLINLARQYPQLKALFSAQNFDPVKTTLGIESILMMVVTTAISVATGIETIRAFSPSHIKPHQIPIAPKHLRIHSVSDFMSAPSTKLAAGLASAASYFSGNTSISLFDGQIGCGVYFGDSHYSLFHLSAVLKGEVTGSDYSVIRLTADQGIALGSTSSRSALYHGTTGPRTFLGSNQIHTKNAKILVDGTQWLVNIEAEHLELVNNALFVASSIATGDFTSWHHLKLDHSSLKADNFNNESQFKLIQSTLQIAEKIINNSLYDSYKSGTSAENFENNKHMKLERSQFDVTHTHNNDVMDVHNTKMTGKELENAGQVAGAGDIIETENIENEEDSAITLYYSQLKDSNLKTKGGVQLVQCKGSLDEVSVDEKGLFAADASDLTINTMNGAEKSRIGVRDSDVKFTEAFDTAGDSALSGSTVTAPDFTIEETGSLEADYTTMNVDRMHAKGETPIEQNQEPEHSMMYSILHGQVPGKLAPTPVDSTPHAHTDIQHAGEKSPYKSSIGPHGEIVRTVKGDYTFEGTLRNHSMLPTTYEIEGKTEFKAEMTSDAALRVHSKDDINLHDATLAGGSTMTLETDGYLKGDRFKAYAKDDIDLLGKKGVTMHPKITHHEETKKKSNILGSKKTTTKWDTIDNNAIVSENGDASVKSENGAADIKGTDIVATKGTATVAAKDTVHVTGTKTNREIITKSHAAPVWHSKSTQNHEEYKEGNIAGKNVVIHSKEGDVIREGINVQAEEDATYDAPNGDVIQERKVLNHDIKSSSSGIAVTKIGGVTVQNLNEQSIGESPSVANLEDAEPMFDAVRNIQNAKTRSEKEAAIAKAAMGGINTVAHAANAINNGNAGAEVLSRYGLGNEKNGFNPSITFHIGAEKSESHYQTTSGGGTHANTIHVNAKNKIALNNGEEMIAKTSIEMNADTVQVDGAKLESSNKSSSVGVDLGITLLGPTPSINSVGVSASHAQGSATTHEMCRIEAPHMTINAREMAIKSGTVTTDKLEGHVDKLTITSEQDTKKQDGFSLGASMAVGPSSDGSVSGSVSVEHVNNKILTEKSGIFAKDSSGFKVENQTLVEAQGVEAMHTTESHLKDHRSETSIAINGTLPGSKQGESGSVARDVFTPVGVKVMHNGTGVDVVVPIYSKDGLSDLANNISGHTALPVSHSTDISESLFSDNDFDPLASDLPHPTFENQSRSTPDIAPTTEPVAPVYPEDSSSGFSNNLSGNTHAPTDPILDTDIPNSLLLENEFDQVAPETELPSATEFNSENGINDTTLHFASAFLDYLSVYTEYNIREYDHALKEHYEKVNAIDFEKFAENTDPEHLPSAFRDLIVETTLSPYEDFLDNAGTLFKQQFPSNSELAINLDAEQWAHDHMPELIQNPESAYNQFFHEKLEHSPFSVEMFENIKNIGYGITGLATIVTAYDIINSAHKGKIFHETFFGFLGDAAGVEATTFSLEKFAPEVLSHWYSLPIVAAGAIAGNALGIHFADEFQTNAFPIIPGIYQFMHRYAPHLAHEIDESARFLEPSLGGRPVKDMRNAGAVGIGVSLSLAYYDIYHAKDPWHEAEHQGVLMLGGMLGSVAAKAGASLVCEEGAPVCEIPAMYAGGSLGSELAERIWQHFQIPDTAQTGWQTYGENALNSVALDQSRSLGDTLGIDILNGIVPEAYGDTTQAMVPVPDANHNNMPVLSPDDWALASGLLNTGSLYMQYNANNYARWLHQSYSLMSRVNLDRIDQIDPMKAFHDMYVSTFKTAYTGFKKDATDSFGSLFPDSFNMDTSVNYQSWVGEYYHDILEHPNDSWKSYFANVLEDSHFSTGALSKIATIEALFRNGALVVTAYDIGTSADKAKATHDTFYGFEGSAIGGELASALLTKALPGIAPTPLHLPLAIMGSFIGGLFGVHLSDQSQTNAIPFLTSYYQYHDAIVRFNAFDSGDALDWKINADTIVEQMAKHAAAQAPDARIIDFENLTPESLNILEPNDFKKEFAAIEREHFKELLERYISAQDYIQEHSTSWGRAANKRFSLISSEYSRDDLFDESGDLRYGALRSSPRSEYEHFSGKYEQAWDTFTNDIVDHSDMSPRAVTNMRNMGIAGMFLSSGVAIYDITRAKNHAAEAAHQGVILAGGLAGGFSAEAGASLLCGEGAPLCFAALLLAGSSLGTEAGDKAWRYADPPPYATSQLFKPTKNENECIKHDVFCMP